MRWQGTATPRLVARVAAGLSRCMGVRSWQGLVAAPTSAQSLWVGLAKLRNTPCISSVLGRSHVDLGLSHTVLTIPSHACTALRMQGTVARGAACCSSCARRGRRRSSLGARRSIPLSSVSGGEGLAGTWQYDRLRPFCRSQLFWP